MVKNQCLTSLFYLKNNRNAPTQNKNMKKAAKQKILIIQGPNMNLLGLRTKADGHKITLDKLNRHLREIARKIGLSLTIIQTNDEGRAVNLLQGQRKKIKGVLLFPGPWQKSGHVIKETLEILSAPCITVSLGEKKDVFKKMKNIEEANIYKSSEKALTELAELI